MSKVVTTKVLIDTGYNKSGLNTDYWSQLIPARNLYRRGDIGKMIRHIRKYPVRTYTEEAQRQGYDQSLAREIHVQAVNTIARILNHYAEDGIENREILNRIFSAAEEILG